MICKIATIPTHHTHEHELQGKEEQTYNQSMYTKNSINKAITDKSKLSDFLSAPERLVPHHLNPACHRMSMQVGTFVSAKSNNGCVGPENNRRISGMLKRSNSGTPGSSYRQASRESRSRTFKF